MKERMKKRGTRKREGMKSGNKGEVKRKPMNELVLTC